ncbi:MAG: DUF5110 domain-containing protein, partial [Asticcacaulis sp.]|nr:DUF5110 domain-containing protein [Asticcacaulis sp.]
PALNQMPVYVRAGAIIPQTPGLQYAMHKPDRIELHVYAGADGSFALYDDAGDGHGYERGEFRRWPLRWDDKARTLVFDVAEGSYAPDEEVAFTIVRHDGMGRGETTVTAVPSQTLSVSF